MSTSTLLEDLQASRGGWFCYLLYLVSPSDAQPVLRGLMGTTNCVLCITLWRYFFKKYIIIICFCSILGASPQKFHPVSIVFQFSTRLAQSAIPCSSFGMQEQHDLGCRKSDVFVNSGVV